MAKKMAKTGDDKKSASDSVGAKKKIKKASGQGFSPSELTEFYRQMLKIRRFEEKAGQLYGMGLIGGYCHLYIGQEAVVVGIQSQMHPQDSSITGYRLHGHFIVSGGDPKALMAELTGRRDGCSGGKGGSMHMFAPDKGFYGGHGIVGAQVPLGAGLAFAHRYREDKGAAVVYFGDGAANQGQVAETMNMASLWKLPLLMIIENNQYGMGTSVDRIAAGSGLAHRGEAFGIEWASVDGMDVGDVALAARKGLDHCRAGKGPVILEAMTYRYRGHSMSDPGKYRSRDEVDHVREERDAISSLRELLLEEKICSEKELKDMDRECKEIAAQAASFAQESPEPEPAELEKHIYATG